MEQNYKHKAVVYGYQWEMEYWAVHPLYGEPRFKKIRTNGHSTVLWSGELDMPLMKYDDNLYLPFLDKTVRIRNVKRSTTNEVFYYTDYEEYVETEKTKESLEIAKKELEEMKKVYNLQLKNKSLPRSEPKKSFMEKIDDFFFKNKNKK